MHCVITTESPFKYGTTSRVFMLSLKRIPIKGPIKLQSRQMDFWLSVGYKILCTELLSNIFRAIDMSYLSWNWAQFRELFHPDSNCTHRRPLLAGLRLRFVIPTEFDRLKVTLFYPLRKTAAYDLQTEGLIEDYQWPCKSKCWPFHGSTGKQSDPFHACHHHLDFAHCQLYSLKIFPFIRLVCSAIGFWTITLKI